MSNLHLCDTLPDSNLVAALFAPAPGSHDGGCRRTRRAAVSDIDWP